MHINLTIINISPSVRCTSLTDPANGRLIFDRRTFGGIAIYSCNTGYTLSGSSSRICQSNGAWSGSPGTCNQGMLHDKN